MKNNSGTTSEVLTKTLGATQDFDKDNVDTITLISGELGLGFILFDKDGTMAICSELDEDDEGNPIYRFVISALSAETLINLLLGQSY